MTSGAPSTIAAGPTPSRRVSASTAEAELEPRPAGITSTAPAIDLPRAGWWTSMIVPSSARTPPQNETGSVTNASPAPRPGASPWPRASSGPEAIVPHDRARDRRAGALLEAAERDVDAEVAGRVIGPLAARGHDRPAHRADHRRDVGAGVDDDLHAGLAQRGLDAGSGEDV